MNLLRKKCESPEKTPRVSRRTHPADHEQNKNQLKIGQYESGKGIYGKNGERDDEGKAAWGKPLAAIPGLKPSFLEGPVIK